ncbi:NADPH-dependent FMN reductase [Actinoplanes sp. NPDC049265]|uniref:NADPH-dependent FMN reductase n=1 Tax=Actinoplanes sp. NPDC049265 TaxID=3363902 RepID=UPI003722B1D4
MARILLISGSTRDDSLPTAALRTTARVAPPGVTAVLYDALRVLPAFVPLEDRVPGSVALVRDQVTAADGLLFCTPEYGGSLPGSLKNLLDWLTDGPHLTGKPVAWLSIAPPGQDDGARAGLEAVLDHGGARVLRAACIRIPLGPTAVDGHGLIADQRFHQAAQDVLLSLSRSQAPPEPQPQPSWQAYSSLYPMVPQTDTSALRAGGRPRPTYWPAPGGS